jgi:AAA ATPase domain
VIHVLDEARAGRGRLVLCTGEAGIGKTRLAEECAAAATARGVAVVWARSADRDSSPPYGLGRLVLQDPPVRRGCIAPPPMCREDYGLASYTTLISVSLARRKRVRPPLVTTSRILASPAWPPSASPTSCDSDAGVHSRVEKP